MRYGLIAWGGTTATNLHRVLVIQKRAIRTLKGLGPLDTCRAAFKSLENREEQIEELQQQLAQANASLAESKEIITQLRAQLKSKPSKQGESPRRKKMEKELSEAQSRLKLLEARVADAENDAEVKAEEMTEMVIQLREYETGVFGLPEAMEQIKELQKQKKIRDRHIEQLIQAGNQLQADANLLEEENLALREKLGLDVDAVVRVDGVLAKYKADQTKLSEITQQLESANNTQLTLKVQNRIFKKTISRLKSQLKNVGYEPEVISSEEDSSRQPPVVVQGISEETKEMLIREAELLENKLKDVVDENEALRKGMHEILDSVRSHDGASTVQIESACLERLLEALDSRHLSGWYHPAMRLQAQLNMVEGNNAALREQLRNSRLSEHEASIKLQKALSQVEVLQHELQNFAAKPFREGTPGDVQSPEAQDFKGSQDPEKENGYHTKLEQDLSNLVKKLSETELSMAEQKEIYESDKESWQNVRAGLQNEVDTLTEKVAVLSAEVKEYSENWKTLEEDPDTMKSSLANATIRLAAICAENEKLKRKCSVLQELDLRARNNRDMLQEELAAVQQTSVHKIEELKQEKNKLEADFQMLKNIHAECFSYNELEELRLEFNKLTVKHRELLANKTIIDQMNSKLINQLKVEISQYQESFDKIITKSEDANQISDKQKSLISNKQTEEISKDMKSHSEKMYKLVKDQLKESEDHCKDLEKQLAALVQQNLTSQLAEAELRDQLVDSVPHSRFIDVKTQLTNSEKLIVELKAESIRLQESVVQAESRVKDLEQLRHCHGYQHDALQRQVLELTASSEDKLTIGRLTRELLRAQESELASADQVKELKDKIEKLENLCSQQETKMKTLQDHHCSEKTDMKNKYRWLSRTVSELHQRYLGHMSLLSEESLQALLAQANFEKTNALQLAMTSHSTDKLMEILKDKINGVEGNTALKLQELKLKVNVQTLESQLHQTEGQLQRIEKVNSILQEELLNQEKIWEKKQLIWEQKLLKITADSENTDEKVPPIDNEFQDQNKKAPQNITEEKVESLSKNTNKKEEKETMTSPKTKDFPESPFIIESENLKILNNQLNQVTMVMNEQTKKLNLCETEMTELRSRVEALRKQLDEKERKLEDKERELLELHTSIADKDQIKLEEESTEILALKATVASLQNIVNQKEETIGRYQNLLQECRDEHSATVANLQKELSNLQLTLDKKEISFAKEKSKDNEGDRSSAMKVILERYLARVRQLEDDLAQCRDQAARLALELSNSQQQTERWTHTAEERLKTIQEMKQRLDSARSKEYLTDSNSDLMEKSTEIGELNKIISNLKSKLDSKESVSATRDRLRGELDRANKKLEVVQNQNTELKTEVQRLRKQLTLRQSSTPKSETVSTAREEVLQKKIKQLEEQLTEYQEIIQRGKEIHKSKCDEEFGKWEERKRWQASNEKLKTHLKEKSSQVEALRANVERLKETIIRLEKEKITLEGKLKSTKAPNISQSLIDELERDRAKLQEELKAVRITNQIKSSPGSSLADVVEAQERKIATLKIAQKGESALAEEVERLLERKSRLQQTNLRLEAQNLELKMQLEKHRLTDLTPRDPQDLNSETESVGASPKGRNKTSKQRGDLERAVVVLKRVVEKLQAENKKLHAARLSDVHDKGYVEKLQIELQRCQENYLDSVDKCSILEEELQKCKEKLKLFEHDDLAEELILTKSQLAQKCQLLSKVKVLLENAVIREKALKEQVYDLEKLVPPERLRGTYHERKT
ncbi:centrosomal protein of 290 kDa-like [Homalodisca vitripennis]|uniref:centrosomal protein of 290 kDa-like n=1 Tax=Homalodisca vitripennis TaxID=197043 RepID=UPI001EEBA82D|nr:centrosomal protein of 290 kDa-like [Homalodisca vitripennis]